MASGAVDVWMRSTILRRTATWKNWAAAGQMVVVTESGWDKQLEMRAEKPTALVLRDHKVLRLQVSVPPVEGSICKSAFCTPLSVEHRSTIAVYRSSGDNLVLRVRASAV